MKQTISSTRSGKMYKSTFGWLVVLMALCGGLLCRPALAGHWEVELHVSGSIRNGSYQRDLSIQGPESQPNATGDEYFIDQPLVYEKLDMSGSFSPILRWVDDFGTGEQPPDRVFVRVSGNVNIDESITYQNVYPPPSQSTL